MTPYVSIVCMQLCSVSLVAGLLVCLHSAAKITHKTQAITSVAAAWHADATIHAFDNDLEDPDPALPAATGYLAPANAYRVASGEESDGYNDDDDARSDDSLDDPKLVPFQVNNMCFQKRQALGKGKGTLRQESIAGTRQHQLH
jgi:hypothetical protein